MQRPRRAEVLHYKSVLCSTTNSRVFEQGQIILSCLGYKDTILKDGVWKNQAITRQIQSGHRMAPKP